MNQTDKLKKLREQMHQQGVQAYIIPRADEYQGEFVAPYAERLSYLTGFTGSAGMAIVTNDKAVVLSDGRYTLQLGDQVDANLYDVGDSTKVKPVDWLGQGAEIGYDPRLYTVETVAKWTRDGLKPQAVTGNLIDAIWSDQTARPQGNIEQFPDSIAGSSSVDKIAKISANIDQDYMLIAAPDSLAWLLNIRGNSIDFVPVHHAMGLLDVASGKVAMDDFPDTLQGKTVAIDPAQTSIYHRDMFESLGAKIEHVSDPCEKPRASKSMAEISAIKAAHVQDGLAMVQFIKWASEELPKGGYTEMDVSNKIDGLRAQQKGFRGLSFPTIAGFADNGAVIHYRATPEKHSSISGSGLLLVDSGGQYLSEKDGIAGTTDITRTIAVGDVSDEIKRHFTAVLQGHIALASARFDLGTLGKELDAITRAPLKAEGLEYAHGTGHGVGCYSWVHEHAASISPLGKKAMQPNMLVSNEPGYYEAGSHGIRIESLILAYDNGDKLGFDTVTLAPLDRSLIVDNMLSDKERKWIEDYHAQVYKELFPYLDDAHKNWLESYIGKKPSAHPSPPAP